MSKSLLIKNKDGKDIGNYDVPENLLEYDKGDHAVHEVVVAYQAHQRAGTASTLSKSFSVLSKISIISPILYLLSKHNYPEIVFPIS